jgi:hypothetical protein
MLEQDTVRYSHKLLVARTKPQFNARLSKSGRILGLGMKIPKSKEAEHIIVSEVMPDTVVTAYNSDRASTGRWDLIVLPGMSIWGVNEIKGDASRMMRAMCTEEKVELQIRYPTFGTSAEPPLTSRAAIENGATIEYKEWQIELPRSVGTASEKDCGLGFEVQTFHSGRRYTNVVDKTHGLFVSRAYPSGDLATWNIRNPNTAVKAGDMIVELNGVSTRELSPQDFFALREELEKRSHLLKLLVIRHAGPAFFNLRFQKMASHWALASKTRLHPVEKAYS